MAYIDFFDKDEKHVSGETTISPSREKYLENFQKVTYNITYSKPFDLPFWTGAPRGEFLKNNLDEKLQLENDKRNKLKFVTEKGKSQNYFIIDDNTSVRGFIRYEHKAKDDEKYEEHRVSTERLLSKEELSDKTIINKLFDSINGSMFYFINVYYNINKNVTLLIEFVSESTKIHFERKDDEGYYWEKKSLSYNHEIDTNPNLRNIETQIENSVSYDLERDGGNYMKGKIIVSSETKGTNKYTVYKHSIDTNELLKVKKMCIVYYTREIKVVKNDKIQDQEKLENLNNQIFKEIKTFSLNNSLKEHLLIKLNKNNGCNYYFRRFNKNGTEWRQVSTEDLENLGIQANHQKIDQLLSETNKSSDINVLLEHIRFEINSICILLDHKSEYTKSMVQEVVGTHSKEKYAPPIDIETSTVSVKDDTDLNGKCLKTRGYRVYKHSLNYAASKGVVKAVNNDLYLRFYVDKSQIKLYKNQNANGQQTYVKYQNNKNELYVYFDGEKSKRVLLLCYNGKAYKAKNQDSYKTKWIPITNIKACVCQGANESYEINRNLIRELDNSKLPNVFHLYDKSGYANDYKYSELFHSYLRNQPESAKASDIEVYKEKDGKKLILKPSGEYLSKAAKISEVYFNKYNESNSPLILLISFQDATERLYYSLSQFEDDLVNQFKSIDQLTRLEEAKFLDALISENDKSKDFLTFNIEETYNNDLGATNKYNSNNIQIAEDSNSVPSLLGKGFKRYKHTPVRQSYTKKACVMYKNNVLLHWNDNQSKSGAINDFQGQVLKSVTVYFSNKTDKVPLLVGFEINKARDKKSYDSYEWIKIVSGTCPCQLNGQNKELLGSLINAVLFLNKVQLEEKENEGTYVVHKFNGKEIKVKIESSVDLPLNSCYKKLIHHPNESGYRLGEIIHTRDANKLTYSSQAPLLSVGVYYNKYDNSYEEPLLIELELSKDIPKTGTLKEFYKYCFDATGTLRWKIERDNNLVTSNISRYLDNIRFGFKKFVKVEIQHNKHISSYQLQVKQSKGPGTFTELNGDSNINVTQESCEKLKEAKYTCFKHQLTSLKGSTQHHIGGLKITIPKQLPIESSPESVSDQEVSLYKIKEDKEYEVLQKIKGQKKEKNKEEEKDTDQNYLYKEVQPYLNPYEPIGYSSCMGDFYVYFYCINGENKGPIIDPRPGLVCFFNRAYRPLKLPEKKNNGKYNYDLDDYNKWISVEDIKKCGCGEQEKLIAILNEVYDIETPNIALIAGSSAGSIAGIASIGGIGFMIFKKVSSVAVTTATAATVSM
ncbi:hypothetical protein MACJ_002421 [Theileria orientalis]|uniref:Uncharacterized protein n=1 Tax=Theileria orientalis TaxID=68886 RepID=A0A976M684_THEOR|nr:hypothetical protein MACJ_002421 [Theileria orientalis]